ncbi:MAG: pilus assembly protein N-terminal domain-containing protein, partial [Gammaproteobacteria bacterium]
MRLRPRRLPIPTVLAVALLAPAAAPTALALTPAADPARMVLTMGTQKELVFDGAVERIAIADESVAGVTIARRTPGSPAARLVITGKAAGGTSLIVWEKGKAAGRTYAIEVQRRTAVLEGRSESLPEHRQARET